MSIDFTNKIWIIFLVVILFPAFLAGGEVDFNPFGTGQAETSASLNPAEDRGSVIPQIEFNNNNISMAFQIISDATGWSIFPTEQVNRAKISLWAKDMTAKQLLDTVVEMAGFIYHKDGDVITVMTYDEYTQFYGLARKVICLEYADAGSIAAVIKPFLSKLEKSVVHKETNTIVLYETQANLEFIAGVIKRLDSPAENIAVEVINLQYADCESLEKILKGIFESQNKRAKNKSSAATDAADSVANKNTTQTKSQNISEVLIPYEQTEIYPVSRTNQLVVVGTRSDIQKVKALIAMVDLYEDNTVLEVIDLKYADAEVLAEILGQVYSGSESKNDGKHIVPRRPSEESSQQNTESKTKSRAGSTSLSVPLAEVAIHPVGRSNQLIIKAFRGDLKKLKELIEKLDTYTEPTTKTYHFTYVDVSEIYSGLERILNSYGSSERSSKESRQSRDTRFSGITLVEKTNSILLTGPPSIHRIMTSIIESIDVPGTYQAGIIRIYKLENADVEEVAETIRELLQNEDKQKAKTAGVKFTEETIGGNSETSGPGNMAKTEEFVPQIATKVSVSKSTNSIVVQATTREHRELEKLIEQLDRRRKQVLIKAMIVEVITSDDMDLGIELGGFGLDGFAFTSFGLSTGLDTFTGARDVIVSPGGTAALLSGNKVKAILHALQSEGNAKITSAPQILVNDNAVGFINAIAEEPTTQVNQGETTTTTSFAGFVEAGTQFAITPHISKTTPSGDNQQNESAYLRVEYEITLNSFGTKPTDSSIPPPRNRSSIRSEATVPNGFTIVVGGLQTTNQSESVDKVPLLGDIPILGLIFRNTVIKNQYRTTYLFITPVIMEDQDFADLKDVSRKAMENIQYDEIRQEELDTETIAG